MSECSGPDDLTNSVAFFIRHDHHDTITETEAPSFIYSLFIGSLLTHVFFVRSAMTSEKFDSLEKQRQGSLAHVYAGLNA